MRNFADEWNARRFRILRCMSFAPAVKISDVAVMGARYVSGDFANNLSVRLTA